MKNLEASLSIFFIKRSRLELFFSATYSAVSWEPIIQWMVCHPLYIVQRDYHNFSYCSTLTLTRPLTSSVGPSLSGRRNHRFLQGSDRWGMHTITFNLLWRILRKRILLILLCSKFHHPVRMHEREKKGGVRKPATARRRRPETTAQRQFDE